MRSGKRRCSASGMCALIVLAARKKRLLRDEHGHAAEWLPISVCKKKCMLLCTLASLNECVSVSTRRETSHIDRPLRLAAPASRTPASCSAAARRARCAFYRRARNACRHRGNSNPSVVCPRASRARVHEVTSCPIFCVLAFILPVYPSVIPN